MPVSVKIAFGGVDYTIPKMNIGQLERMTELVAGTINSSFGILRIAFERAEPKVEHFDLLEATSAEVIEAATAVLEMSGMTKRKVVAGEPTPPETTPNSGGDTGTTSSVD